MNSTEKPHYKLTLQGVPRLQDAGAVHKVISERLHAERIRLSLSQTEAAAITGVSRNMWGRYERCACVPGADILFVARKAGFNTEFILGGAKGGSA